MADIVFLNPRFEEQFLGETKPLGGARARNWRAHPIFGLRRRAACLGRVLVLYLLLSTRIPDRKLRHEYRRRYHHFSLARTMATGSRGVVNTY